nr:hypothetical protein [Tanacetum cinerariifolium]
MVEKSKLDEDKEGKAVDPSNYHGMISTLLYLTASRPDLQFAICMCARYQARPTKKHDSSVALTTFADADHAGCQDTRRNTSDYGLGFNNILMYCDNKSAIALCCSNVQHSRSKHIDIRYHFINEHVENGVIELYFVNTEYQLLDLFTKALGRDRIEFLINKLGMRSFMSETLKQLMDEVDETMDTTIEQQAAMDEALLVYNVMRICPSFKAFLVIADVPEIYMQEFWATATVHQHAIRFKMDNKKHIVNLESFRDMLHICPRVHGQSFDEPPFEEEILAFIRFLGHSVATRMLTDVNINKLYQPWRSFATIIIKCLTGKSSVYDSLRLSQAQILWGLYHKRNVDYAYLMWEDFDPSIPRRNKVNWHYVRDDHIFSTIKLVSRHQNMQQFGASPPKPKASIRRTRSNSDTSITPPTAAASTRLTSSQKGKQAAKASKAKNEGSGSKPGVPDVPTDESEEELSWNSTDNEGDADKGKDGDDDEEEGGDDDQEYDDDDDDENAKETRDEERFDPIPQTPKNSDDEGNGDEDLRLNIGGEERHIEEEEEDELYIDSSSVSSQFVTSMLNLTLDVGMESIFETTSQLDVQTPTSVAPLPISAPTMMPSTISTITTTSQATILPTTVPSNIIQNLPNFGSLFRFDDRLRSLESNFSEAMQTNQFAGASDRLRDEAQRDNDEFLKIVDENMQTIIKEKVKEQVKVQVSKILPRIEQAVNEQLEAEVLTRSSHSSKTSYAVVADLSEMELKKILIEKIEGNKSIQRSDEQRNLYKALVEAYESDKIILDTYEETVTLKRRRDDDADKDEEPSTGPDRGSKRRREGKEPESASALTKTATRSAVRSIQGSKSRHVLASKSALVEEPMQTTSQMEEPSYSDFDTELLAGPTYELMKGSCKSLVELEYHLEEVFKITTDQLDWVNPEGQQYPYNLLKPLPLIPNNRGRRVIPFEHFINNDLEYLRGGALSRKYTTSITKTKAADYEHIKWIEDLVPRTMWIEEPLGYDKHALWGNKDKNKRLMRINELHKFSYGMLTDVRTALYDRLKGIRMQYLPQSIWRKSDKDKAAAMIQVIDKRLKTRRIMRSLERFVGGRLYEGDFRMLQRTI